MPRKLTCTVCGRADIRFRPDHTVGNHREPQDWSPCEGSRKPPVWAEVPDPPKDVDEDEEP